jgi:hypothetical protein
MILTVQLGGQLNALSPYSSVRVVMDEAPRKPAAPSPRLWRHARQDQALIKYRVPGTYVSPELMSPELN